MANSSRNNQKRLIICIDYGTTFTGISYVLSGQEPREIRYIDKWPAGKNGVIHKAPTAIAYTETRPSNPFLDNPSHSPLSTSAWGYGVKSTVDSYTWTKLLLDDQARPSQFDDPTLRDARKTGMLRLPKDKSAQAVCEDYLREVYAHMLVTLHKRYSDDILNACPMECWLTVPATWSDGAKQKTKAAARAAGFASREKDALYIIAESEAAAWYALSENLPSTSFNPVQRGENIIVCDCGGGTVDITALSVIERDPHLKLRSLGPPLGAKCGSTFIDRNFNQWMANTFHDTYTSLPERKRGPSSGLMQAFESAKRSFGDESERGSSRIEIEGAHFEIHDSEYYDYDNALVVITDEIMQSFFDPVVDRIIDLLDVQFTDLENRGIRKIDRLLLVGGFGDSTYLNTRLKEWCSSKGQTQMTCPPDCISAVFRGAALRALLGPKIQDRRSRRHYGYSTRCPFRNGYDDESNAAYDDFSGEKFRDGCMYWIVEKNTAFAELTTRFQLYHSIPEGKQSRTLIELWSSTDDSAPEFLNKSIMESAGKLVIDYPEDVLRTASSQYSTTLRKQVRNVQADIEVEARADESVLVFKAFASGKEISETTIHIDG